MPKISWTFSGYQGTLKGIGRDFRRISPWKRLPKFYGHLDDDCIYWIFIIHLLSNWWGNLQQTLFMILWVGHKYKLLDAYQVKLPKGRRYRAKGLAYGLKWDSQCYLSKSVSSQKSRISSFLLVFFPSSRIQRVPAQFSVKNPLNLSNNKWLTRDLPFLHPVFIRYMIYGFILKWDTLTTHGLSSPCQFDLPKKWSSSHHYHNINIKYIIYLYCLIEHV